MVNLRQSAVGRFYVKSLLEHVRNLVSWREASNLLHVWSHWGQRPLVVQCPPPTIGQRGLLSEWWPFSDHLRDDAALDEAWHAFWTVSEVAFMSEGRNPTWSFTWQFWSFSKWNLSGFNQFQDRDPIFISLFDTKSDSCLLCVIRTECWAAVSCSAQVSS